MLQLYNFQLIYVIYISSIKIDLRKPSFYELIVHFTYTISLLTCTISFIHLFNYLLAWLLLILLNILYILALFSYILISSILLCKILIGS